MQTLTAKKDLSSRKTILVVDDNSVERAILVGFLKEDYEIVTASGGAEAISYLEQSHEHISALVLDIVMPGMDGYDVMKRLRDTVALAHIPIIVSTCLEDDETREKAIAYGAVGFITKPYNRTLLLHAVRNAVRLGDRLAFELNTLLNVIPSGVMKYAADEGEQFEYVNRNFVENLGYTEEAFKEKFNNCFREMIWHEDRDWAEAEVVRQEGGGEIGKFDYRVEAADGQLRWIHDEGIRITDSDGRSWYYVSLFDITEQREAQEKLRVSEEVNRLAMEHSGRLVTRFDIRTRTLSLPESLKPIFDIPHLLENIPEEQIALGRISPDTAHIFRKLFEDVVSGSESGTATYQQSSTLGWRWIETHYTTVFSDAKEPVSAVVTFEDVTERLEREVVYSKWQQSLSERPEASYTLFRCNLSKNSFYDSCVGTLIDLDFTVNRHDFGELTSGYLQKVYAEDREKYLAFVNSDTMLASYYRGRRSDSLEYREVRADGSLRWLLLSVELVEYPNSKDVEVYLMYEDINESKLSELATRKKAETDPLTGVLNRTTFAAQMQAVIDSSKPGEKHALMMIDIDDFKHINDRFGHDAGDQALQSLTRSIRARLRRDDLVGRLGGDEFLVFLKNIPDESVAAAKAGQICAIKDAADSEPGVSVSIGIAMIPKDGSCFEMLYKKADVALYRKKSDGKNGHLFVGGNE